MRIACIIQARTGSTRLPNKIHADIGGWPMIKHVTTRAEKIGIPVIVAMPEEYQCDENDVLARYWQAAQKHSLDAIMRITGDCPFIDPEACREVMHVFVEGSYDYVANDWRQFKSYPSGMGCEIFKRHILESAFQYSKDKEREHVTPWIKRQCHAREFEGFHVTCPIHTDTKFSVDTAEDLEFARRIDAARPADYSLAATLEAYRRA